MWAVDLGSHLMMGFRPNLPPDPLQIAGATALSWAVNLALMGWIVGRWRGLSFPAAFAIRRPTGAQTLAAVGIGAGGALVALASAALLPGGNSTMVRLVSTPSGLAVASVIAVVVPPLEELYYRGFLYPSFRDLTGGRAAVVVVSIWFASAHLLQLRGDLGGLVVIFCMGVVWTTMRHVTGSVTVGVISHLVYNATLVSAALVRFVLD